MELILEKLAAGQTEEQILRAHSRLTHEAILARGCGLSSRARSFVKLVADESIEGQLSSGYRAMATMFYTSPSLTLASQIPGAVLRASGEVVTADH